MTLELKQDMDPHSLTLERDGKRIGFVQWHADRPPRIVLNDPLSEISFEEIQQCVNELRVREVQLPRDPLMKYIVGWGNEWEITDEEIRRWHNEWEITNEEIRRWYNNQKG